MTKLKWIRPGYHKEPNKKCEFCGSDIEVQYKGVHDEIELILGIATPCRNNGKMNINIWLGYPEGNEPKENVKWFVEHPETHLYWSGYKWTNDPLEAFGCDCKMTADRYARFQHIKEYIITEHEFC